MPERVAIGPGRQAKAALEPRDRLILGTLQEGIPICERPFREVADRLSLEEDEVIATVARLLRTGVLTRFGPMYDVEKLGGSFVLGAMAVPPADFDRVARVVNAFPEVAHNYEREHRFNMWFVVATERPERADDALTRIERETGYPVLALPKEAEYRVSFKVDLESGAAQQLSQSGASDSIRLTGFAEPSFPDPDDRDPLQNPGSGSSANSSGPANSRIPPTSCGPAGSAGPETSASSANGKPRPSGAIAPAPSGLADPITRSLVMATQAGLPLARRPFHAVAIRLGLDAHDVLRRFLEMLETGAIRRVAAVPNHYAVGTRANGMTVFDVPDDSVDRWARVLAGIRGVTHCYRRPRRPPEWPYNLFAMLHGPSRDVVEDQARHLAELMGADMRGQAILYSTRILKKTGLRLVDAQEAMPCSG